MSRITRLEAENVKRIRAVTIEPDGNVVVVGGRNGQGKSSCLDAIVYAFAGAKAIPAEPLRRGAKQGHIRIEIDDLPHAGPCIIERTFDAKGKSKLTITSKGDGYEAPTPQTILDGLYSKLAFDPLMFLRTKPKEQLEQLRGLVGLDFTNLDRERAKAFADRTDVNRRHKQAAAELAACPQVEAPDAEVSAADITAELRQAMATNREHENERHKLGELDREIETRKASCQSMEQEIADFERRIAKLKAELAARQQNLMVTLSRRDELADAIDKLADIDLAPIEQRLNEVELTNRRVRQKQQRAKLVANVAALEGESAALTKRLDEIDTQKADAMAAAPFPVPGLGFGDEGITLGGLPFEQASSAEQLRVSVAIGLALNPELRVMLIREGSLLDEDSLAVIASMASERDAQVWIERVSEGKEVSVVIEDGAVREPAAV